MVALLAPAPFGADARQVQAHVRRLAEGMPDQLRTAITKVFDSFFEQLRKHVFPELLNADPVLKPAQVAQVAGLIARNILFTYFDLTEELAQALGRDGEEIRELLAGAEDAPSEERMLSRVEATFGPLVAENLARVGADLETMEPYFRATLPATLEETSALMFERLKPAFGGAWRAAFIRLAISSAALDAGIARRQEVVEELARVAREDVLQGWIALRMWLKEREPQVAPAPAPSDEHDDLELPPPDWSDL